jgi:general secretion pathway protein J
MSARRGLSGSRTRHAQSAGFTLIEMLVALALLGLLSTLLFGGFRLGLRTWEAGDRKLDHADEIMAVQGFLRRELAQTYAVAQGLGQPLAFWGEADSVVFFAPLPERGNIGGLYALKIAAIGSGGNGHRLQVGWQLFRSDMAISRDFAPDQTNLLLDGVESISFSYFGNLTAGAPAEWHDQWVDRLSLPILIRMTVQFRPDAGRQWPPFTVALKLRGLG